MRLLKPRYRTRLRACMNRSRGSAAAPVIFPTFLLLSLGACGGGGGGPIDGQRAYEHVRAMVALGPRPAGSEALAKNAAYLQDQLRSYGLEPQEQVWEQKIERYDEKRTLTLRNVWVEVPGADPSGGPIVVIGAHYDTKHTDEHPQAEQNFPFVGAIDGAGGSAVLLELARALKGRQNHANYWLVWFDGEESPEFEWNQEMSLLGSKHFVATMKADKTRFPEGLTSRMKAMVLLDLIGSKGIKIDRDHKSFRKLSELFGRAAERMGESDRMFRYVSQMTDDHQSFIDAGVPSIDLIDFRWRTAQEWAVPAERWRKERGEEKPAEGTYAAWWHTPQDDLSQVSAESLAFAGNLVWNALPEIEQKFCGAR